MTNHNYREITINASKKKKKKKCKIYNHKKRSYFQKICDY